VVARTIERQYLPMIKDEFGKKIQTFRKTAAMTQEALADRAGLGNRFLQDIEAGNKQPTITTVFRLAKALDLTPGELLDPIYYCWNDEVSSKAGE